MMGEYVYEGAAKVLRDNDDRDSSVLSYASVTRKVVAAFLADNELLELRTIPEAGMPYLEAVEAKVLLERLVGGYLVRAGGSDE